MELALQYSSPCAADPATAEEAEAGRWKRARSSSVMARPSAACSLLKLAARARHSVATVRKAASAAGQRDDKAKKKKKKTSRSASPSGIPLTYNVHCHVVMSSDRRPSVLAGLRAMATECQRVNHT